MAVSILVAMLVFAPRMLELGEIPRNPLITAAAIVFLFSGYAGVAGAIPSILYMSQTGRFPGIGSITFYDGALFDRLWGVRGVMVSIVPFAILGVVEMLAGVWLWRSLQIGGILGLSLTPFAAVFLVGYGAPYLWVVVPLRVILVALAWSTLI